MDLRCEHKKFAELTDGILSIKCSSSFCGARRGVVVIHRFDALTGELIDTQRFADPVAVFAVKEGSTSGTEHDSVAVRSA